MDNFNMTPRRRRQLTLISPVTHSSPPQYFITLVEVMRKDKKSWKNSKIWGYESWAEV